MAKSRSATSRRGRATHRSGSKSSSSGKRTTTTRRASPARKSSSSKASRGSASKGKRKVYAKGSTPQVDRAEAIIRATVKGGAGRATSVLRAIKRAGISTRTYRTARKRMKTSAVRRSFKGISKGRGQWYVSLG
jgi:hypothetical protein